ncbi:MAG TPA: Lrp/AsnC family transcriptional regulator [Candidatus Sumerlaeota bacterium]|nr:Lrp/AsnC family transcriptional regulator [Candidatus Sumerlaeota bacterium]HPS02637.1 Lrp/AsnC family transcriptional regulator [Candidatus Sumerlaeota bacterium]
MDVILEILKENARTPNEQIAKRLGRTPEEVERQIAQLEKERVILGYQAIVHPEKCEDNLVTGIIEVKIAPQRGSGFDSIAQRIYKFPEVKLCYLLSGAYDLLVIVEGHSLKEVAAFVSERLSTLEHVSGTATHFILKKYKDFGVIMQDVETQERLPVIP